MSSVISSGNAIVDAMGRMDIVGDLLPLSWLKEITFDNGHADFAGAVILADLAYWYRPSIVSDGKRGSTRWKKKFKSDLVQMGYAQIERRFNLSRDQAKNALRRLEERGLIKRHFRNVEERGRRYNNVMFIEINPEKIAEITYSINEKEDETEGVCGYIQMPTGINTHRVEDETTETGDSIHTPEGIEPRTNTKNITEITKKDYPSITQIKERFKEQIDYDVLLIDYPYDEAMLNEIVEISTEVLASDRENIRVNGENWPGNYVKQRYRKLDMNSIAYVLECLKNHTGGASNIRGFIITTLFNAAATLDTYVNVKVNRALAVNENNISI